MVYLHNGKAIVDGCTVIYTVATHNKIEQLDLEISWNYGQHSPLLFLSGLLYKLEHGLSNVHFKIEGQLP